MKTDIFGLIYASEENYNLRDLVLHRSVAALPVGGRYRAIDFLLSNMVNTGIRRVGIITQKNYNSLMDHLGSGKEWDLARKNDGLYILPPFDLVANSGNSGIYRDICDALNSKLDYIRSAPQQYCLLSGSYTIYSTSYDRMFEEHIAKGADVTMLYSTRPNIAKQGDESHFKDVRLYTDDDGRVRDIEFDSEYSQTEKLGMDVYLINKTLLEQLVSSAVAHRTYNFVADVLIPNLKHLKVYGVPHEGYVGRLTSLNSYYDINMDMLREDVRRELFMPENPIYTKIKDEPPVRYLDGASVRNSVMGDGCEIYGEVENSILFRGVTIAPGAQVRGCIIMQDTEIQENCRLENMIIDKSCTIRRGVRLMGAPEYPIIIKKGAVI
jgi:glucose-1-phosphate adenylyltransferase